MLPNGAATKRGPFWHTKHFSNTQIRRQKINPFRRTLSRTAPVAPESCHTLSGSANLVTSPLLGAVINFTSAYLAYVLWHALWLAVRAIFGVDLLHPLTPPCAMPLRADELATIRRVLLRKSRCCTRFSEPLTSKFTRLFRSCFRRSISSQCSWRRTAATAASSANTSACCNPNSQRTPFTTCDDAASRFKGLLLV